MSRRLLVPIGTLLVLVACQDVPDVTGPDRVPVASSFSILDGAHGGPAGFYFLPPLVSAPSYAGTFDGLLSPEIHICAVSGGSCDGPDVAVLTTGGPGAASITVDLEGEAYVAVWQTRGAGLEPATDYRLTVMVGTLELGALDLDVVTAPQELKGVPAGMVGLVNGHPLPIKFRIETGIVGEAFVTPSTATVVEGQSQQFSVAFRDLHGSILPGPPFTWVSSDITIATVDGFGLATGVAEGSATITAVNEWVSGTADLEVLPAGLTWTASNPTSMQLLDVWGSSESDVFAVGDQGTILHYDGSSWTSMTSPAAVGTCGISGVWGTSPTNVFATVGGYSGCSSVLHYDGYLWSVVLTLPEPGDNEFPALNDVWGSGPSDVYAAGYDGLLAHFNGSTWSTTYLLDEGGSIHPLYAIWGSAGTDVFIAGGYETIQHYDGSAWTPKTIAGAKDFTGVWGSSGSDVFVVGWDPVILHYGGSAWSAMSGVPENTIGTLRDVWGSDETDVFAVGELPSPGGGLILHYDGVCWSEVAGLPGTAGELYGIWGSSSDDVFVVGADGLILHGTK
jgi:hypothetical protein